MYIYIIYTIYIIHTQVYILTLYTYLLMGICLYLINNLSIEGNSNFPYKDKKYIYVVQDEIVLKIHSNVITTICTRMW